MRNGAVKLICALLVPVLLTGCSGVSALVRAGETIPQDDSPGTVAGTEASQNTSTQPETQPAQAPLPVFIHARQTDETGVPKTIAVHTDDYAYGVHYPVTGNETVDTLLEAKANGIAADFAKSIEGYTADLPENRAILQADYKTYLATDAAQDAAGTYKLLSVIFETYPDVHAGAAHNGVINAAMFDLNTGKSLSVTEVFCGDFLEIISKKTIGHFAGNPDYAEYINTELFTAGTAPKAENFSKFAFIQGQAVFYFDSSAVLPEKFGCLSVSIPLTELYRVLKIKATERAPFRLFDSSQKMVVLTYDDGPKTPYTDRILDALGLVGGKASFFVLGLMIDKNEAVMKRAYLMGCDIANHSYNHKKMESFMSQGDIKYQVDECEKRIIRVTGMPSAFFRMPYGYNNNTADEIIGKPVIAWSFDTIDWAYSDTSKKNRNRSQEQRLADKQNIINRVLDNVKDGDIILMHDIHEFTVELSEQLIPELTARGFQLVTLSELFAARGVQPVNGKHYNHGRP